MGPDEWSLSVVAHLGIPARRCIAGGGGLGPRPKLDEPRGRWILWADAAELEPLRRLRNCPRTWDNQPLLKELTIPKERGQ